MGHFQNKRKAKPIKKVLTRTFLGIRKLGFWNLIFFLCYKPNEPKDNFLKIIFIWCLTFQLKDLRTNFSLQIKYVYIRNNIKFHSNFKFKFPAHFLQQILGGEFKNLLEFGNFETKYFFQILFFKNKKIFHIKIFLKFKIGIFWMEFGIKI